MPEDLEVLWVSILVFVQPVSERAADWLQGVIPARYGKWSMRLVSPEAIEELAIAARRQRLTIGGVLMPPMEGEEEL